MNPLNASKSTVRGLAWKRYSRQTPLRDVAPALNGRASLAGARPCRTGAASAAAGGSGLVGTLDPLQAYRTRWGSMYRERELTRESCAIFDWEHCCQRRNA